ncbi:hypothetical protein AJ87_34515 [Rhizobium yanglingense]|nr:hypothetical protein AJ87_34515 [Rhizobium yanglingense]
MYRSCGPPPGSRTAPKPRKLVACNLQGDDRILECGLFHVSGDRVDLHFMRCESGIEGSGEITVVQRLEARQAMKPVPVDKRRIELLCGRHADVLYAEAGNGNIGKASPHWYAACEIRFCLPSQVLTGKN